jgi:DNA-directed RNA polymerase subunit RPC12/RpoP
MNAGEDDGPVAGSATGNLNVTDREFRCPRCGYAIWILYAEIVAQTSVLCPGCRVRVLLRDAAGSVQLAGEVMQQAQERLVRAWKGLGR